MHERRDETNSGLNMGTAVAAGIGEGKKNDASPDSTILISNSGKGRLDREPLSLAKSSFTESSTEKIDTPYEGTPLHLSSALSMHTRGV
jgi:hypothetical protein